MADLVIAAGGFRLVRDDPEDERTFDAAAAYVPVLGDLVAISGNGEVDECDATDANSLVEPVGVVSAFQQIRTNAGAAGYRVSCARRALAEGFTGLTAGATLFTSTTAGAIESVDPTGAGVTGKVVGFAVNATQVEFILPTL
tara:strand:- start:4031 stop:4456 length:426 start_codon:yes stop_codon:yes gene_type:complete